ncbi:MAG TPA: sugar phosphate isomerase/epimerase [Anaerolineae bacterium]|nr:sugar phosphate isomerase/epimerase [Anaerolineae bacterium]
MNTISFMSANYVARQLGYRMRRGWGQGDRAANEHFRPIETFAARFEEIVRDVRAMGFDALDLWTSHLNPAWATPAHVDAAREVLGRHGVRVVSLAGWFGATPAEFEAACRLAAAVGTGLLGGSTAALDENRTEVVRALRRHGLRLGLENHPEKTPAEMLAKIGDGDDGLIGTTVDTGWYGTQGYDAARAIDALGPHILHVHLKDVLAPEAHDSCRYGRGVVSVRECVAVLKRAGYREAISVEHEPERYDPTEDVVANLAMLRDWLAE